MADVLSNTNLVYSSFSSSFTGHRNEQKNSSCRLKGFPRKVNRQTLRLKATSLGSDFHGKRVVLQDNQGKPKRGIYLQMSIKAQVGQDLIWIYSYNVLFFPQNWMTFITFSYFYLESEFVVLPYLLGILLSILKIWFWQKIFLWVFFFKFYLLAVLLFL